MDGISWRLFFITIAVAAAPLALVHELGHALAAVTRLPGPVTVRVGRDKPLVTFAIGRITIRFHPFVAPWRWHCYCCFASLPGRTDMVWIALAGRAASIATGLLAIAACSLIGTGTVHEIASYIAFDSLFTGLLCLVPMTLTDSRGLRLRTDGALALAALRREVPSALPSANGSESLRLAARLESTAKRRPDPYRNAATGHSDHHDRDRVSATAEAERRMGQSSRMSHGLARSVG